MLTLDFGFGALEQEFWRVMFLMIRIGAALLAAPFFGAANVPPMARLTVVTALAIFIAAWMPVTTPPAILSLAGILAIMGEVLIGLALGFVLTLAFSAPLVAAEVISGGMGMSMAVTSDAAGGGNSTAIGQYLSILLVLIFLALDGHLQFIALLAESYRSFPPGDTWLGAEGIARIPSYAAMMFETALRIALPVALTLLLVQLVTGVLSRSAPSLNLFALGLPAGVMAGLAALIMSAPVVHDQLVDLVSTALDQAAQVVLQ